MLKKKVIVILFLIIFGICGIVFLMLEESTDLKKIELEGFSQIMGKGVQASEIMDISAQVLTKEAEKKFPSVKKIYRLSKNRYGLICKPVGYNGPIRMALVIDSDKQKIIGIKILEHVESEEYVRDFHENWFTERFAGKDIFKYLKVIPLDATKEDEIVIITGATLSTQAVVNGANSAMGIYRDYFLAENCEPVPLMVDFEKDAISPANNLKENGLITFKVDEKVVGSVSIEDIKKMPSVLRKVTIQSTEGTTSHEFRGTLLQNVMDYVDPSLKERYSYAISVGADEYSSEIEMSEILEENKVYLVYEDKGVPLETKEGEPYSMRIVVNGDDFGQRFTNYMTEIILEK